MHDNYSVLIADDERNARENLEMKIKQIPQISSVKMFANPYDVLDYAGKNHIDIAFLDIEMPEINGIEMAMRLKKIQPKMNIVFVTGYSQYAADAFRVKASDYLLKPATVESIMEALDNLRCPAPVSNAKIRIQTFGNFELFINGNPLQITRSKPKELLAYLVDKRGASVTAGQIAAVLWENKDYNRSIQKQTQTVISLLMKILKEAGLGDIIIKGWNNIAVDVRKFDCDYYGFLNGDPAAVNSYTGEYMSEYSWAEMTAGMLTYKIK